MQVLIHGSGVVRAGQWTRKLIINQDLSHGSALPFLKEARERDWGVIVLNTNLNTLEGETIPGSESPEEHAATVWQTMVQPAMAKKVVVVGHSYGGVVAMHLARHFREDFLTRVQGVLLTDSVHGRLSGDSTVDSRLEAVGRNWVGSRLALGETVREAGQGRVERVSAGHEEHEWTTWAAMEEIFRVIRRIEEVGEKWRQGEVGKEEL